MASATPDLRLPSQPQGITVQVTQLDGILDRNQIILLDDRGTRV